MKIVALLLIVLVPGISAGQTPSLGSATEAPHLVRAAGMPLNDGSLAPGMLTVRIVEGAFTHNRAGQVVELEVSGATSQRARTGTDGRAQFAHLPIGARVRASAIIDGQRLESDYFEVPAESGVRILLVAGDGETTASGPAAPAPSGWAASLPPSGPVPTTPPPPPVPADSSVAVIRAVFATATISVFGFMLFTRRIKR
jgi:hypothetical protein